MAYVLDTEHLVVLQRRTQPAFAKLTERLRREDPSDIFVSVISFHEQMQGWLAFLNRARSASDVAFGLIRTNSMPACARALRCAATVLVFPPLIARSFLT